MAGGFEHVCCRELWLLGDSRRKNDIPERDDPLPEPRALDIVRGNWRLLGIVADVEGAGDALHLSGIPEVDRRP